MLNVDPGYSSLWIRQLICGEQTHSSTVAMYLLLLAPLILLAPTTIKLKAYFVNKLLSILDKYTSL